MGGCTEVANAMLSSQYSKYTLIGIVDNDDDLNERCKDSFNRKGFFSNFELVRQENKLFLKRNPDTNQHIIIVDKAIESFLLWNAAEKKIDIGQYGFNDNVRKLKSQTKPPTIETDPEYHRLLTDLYTLKAPGFLTLERILHDFLAS